jgi:hypothetical protein
MSDVLVRSRCPETECANRNEQSQQFNHNRLQRMLHYDEEINFVGAICGHTWRLSKTEKERLRKMLESIPQE